MNVVFLSQNIFLYSPFLGYKIVKVKHLPASPRLLQMVRVTTRVL